MFAVLLHLVCVCVCVRMRACFPVFTVLCVCVCVLLCCIVLCMCVNVYCIVCVYFVSAPVFPCLQGAPGPQGEPGESYSEVGDLQTHSWGRAFRSIPDRKTSMCFCSKCHFCDVTCVLRIVMSSVCAVLVRCSWEVEFSG